MLFVGNGVLQLLQQVGETTDPMIGDKFYQGGLLLIFVSFVLALFKLEAGERARRETAWQIFVGTQAEQFNKAITAQAELLTGAIDRERKQRLETLEQAHREFGGNMDRITGGLVELTKALASHDDNAQNRHERILEAIRHINGAKGA
jgi:hypothetical protein